MNTAAERKKQLEKETLLTRRWLERSMIRAEKGSSVRALQPYYSTSSTVKTTVDLILQRLQATGLSC